MSGATMFYEFLGDGASTRLTDKYFIAQGTRVTSRACTDPYGHTALHRVSDCKARIWPGVKESRPWKPVIGQPREPFPCHPILLTSLP